jgi:Signal transduction histidine kinase
MVQYGRIRADEGSMGVWQALHRSLAQREIGLMWLLLFRWAALSLALAQSFLIEAERLPQVIPQLILVALYTLGWTILALRPAQEATTIMHRRWFVGGDAIALITLNLATGGWHSPLYRYTFAALTMPPYLFGRRGLWGSLALLVAWHGGIAWQQRLPAHVITALALDGMMFGGLLTLSAYALHLVEAQRWLAVQHAAAEERLRIARDLHDDAVQQVYSIVLLLRGCSATAPMKGDARRCSASMRRRCRPGKGCAATCATCAIRSIRAHSASDCGKGRTPSPV